jgi:hypothetical protein
LMNDDVDECACFKSEITDLVILKLCRMISDRRTATCEFSSTQL